MPMLERPISRAGWTRVAFGDVVRLSKARVADPEAAGIERVVGLEHIEPGDLRIRRWGDVADGTTFTTLFRPGQVLFGKRRAYQRKVAVADFEGVCSGDIYVLESANDRLMPELLPFLCQTDAFFDHAVGTSAGSLSPRTNWTSLASFEFLLPPIQEQARLVEVMSAGRSATEATANLLSRLRELRASVVLAVTGGDGSDGVELVRLGEVSNVVRGSTPRPAGDPRYFGGDHISWITVGEITKDDGVYLESTEAKLTELGASFSRQIPSGTVILSNSGWTLGVPKILRITGCANDGVAAFLELDARVDPLFLYFRLFGMTEYLRNVIAAGGDQPNLNTDLISKLTIPLLTLEQQAEAVTQVNAVQAEIDKAKLRLTAQQDLYRSLAGTALVSRELQDGL
jgi:type I restriction enzyme S subunit